MVSLLLPAHQELPFNDRRANFQSRNIMKTLMMITTMHVITNTEFAMIQTFTSSGFSWRQTENAVISATHCYRKQRKVWQLSPVWEYRSIVTYCAEAKCFGVGGEWLQWPNVTTV